MIVAVAAALASAGAAEAADLAEPAAVPAPVAVEYRDIIIDVGFGATLEPLFPAATRYTVNPWPIGELQFLRLPFLGEVVTPNHPSFYIYPVINYVNERDDADAHYLKGLRDVDAALELGLGAAFEYRFVKAFAEVRYGVTGHDGFVGTFGVDAQYKDARWEIAAGPRLELASANYMDTYFSVAPEAVHLARYQADAGVLDVGAAVKASYAITDKWRIQGKAEWTHYLGDAQDSPIAKRGDEDAFMVGLGLTYRFGADLY